MRRLFILLLMCLLPLHGFAAAKMSVEMVSMPSGFSDADAKSLALAAEKSAIKGELESKNTMPCHQSMPDTDAVSAAACLACTACHMLGLSVAFAPVPLANPPFAAPQHVSSADTSADAILAVKPPKSSP